MDKRKIARYKRKLNKAKRNIARKVDKETAHSIGSFNDLSFEEINKIYNASLSSTKKIGSGKEQITVIERELFNIATEEYNRQLEKGGVRMAEERAFSNRSRFYRKRIKKFMPGGMRKRDEQYKQNYISAIINAYGHSEYANKLIEKIKGVSGGFLYNVYNTPGNEDLGVNNIYPGDEEQAEGQLMYLLQRWGEIFG